MLWQCKEAARALFMDRNNRPPGRQLRPPPFPLTASDKPGSWLVKNPSIDKAPARWYPKRPSAHLARDSAPLSHTNGGSPKLPALHSFLPPPTANLIRKSGLHFHFASRFPDGPPSTPRPNLTPLHRMRSWDSVRPPASHIRHRSRGRSPSLPFFP